MENVVNPAANQAVTLSASEIELINEIRAEPASMAKSLRVLASRDAPISQAELAWAMDMSDILIKLIAAIAREIPPRES